MHVTETITSLQNPQVKEWASLHTKKGRDRAHAFLVEGAHLVGEALRSGFEVTTVLYVPGAPAAGEVQAAVSRSAVPWTALSEQVMGKVADTQTPQGVAAIVQKRSVATEDLFSVRGAGLTRAVIAVDAIQDPGNLGTVIRSADAAGAEAVLLGAGTVDLYNPKTIRATMGSLFHLPIVACDLYETLRTAQSKGIKIIATSLEATKTCYEASLGGPVCFLLGNEGAGVTPKLQALADDNVIIPMRGAAESLNVAMAATVLLFEALRQREFSKAGN